MRTILLLILTSASVFGCVSREIEPKSADLNSRAAVVPLEGVQWEQLNPARGDKSPKAGVLWGERTGPGPAGFLLKLAGGFRSPPHIHNVAYRGVVISGLLHNDDPSASDMWMPTGSFWTQPAGEVHITAAKGDNALAYIEVEDEFGVLPKEKAFASDERPVNVDRTNLVWLRVPGSIRHTNSGSVAQPHAEPRISFLWGDPEGDGLRGALVKLPAGFSGTLEAKGSSLQAVVIQGTLRHQRSVQADAATLAPGSYLESSPEARSTVACESDIPCLAYLRGRGAFTVSTNPN